MIKEKVLVISILRVKTCMKDNIRMINDTELESTNITVAPNTKAFTWKIRDMDMVLTFKKMVNLNK